MSDIEITPEPQTDVCDYREPDSIIENIVTQSDNNDLYDLINIKNVMVTAGGNSILYFFRNIFDLSQDDQQYPPKSKLTALNQIQVKDTDSISRITHVEHISGNSYIIVADVDGKLNIFDHQGREINRFDDIQSEVYKMKYDTHHNLLILGSGDGNVYFYDILEGYKQCLSVHNTPIIYIDTINTTRGPECIAVSESGSVCFYSLDTFSIVTVINLDAGVVSCVSLCNDILYCGTESSLVRCVSIQACKLIHTIQLDDEDVNVESIACNNNGSLAIGDSLGNVYIYEKNSFRLKLKHNIDEAVCVTHLIWVDQTYLISIGTDLTIILFDSRDGANLDNFISPAEVNSAIVYRLNECYSLICATNCGYVCSWLLYL